MALIRWAPVIVGVASVLSVAGCATTGPSATELLQDRRLVNRAAFDLDCQTEPISIIRIDEKTRGARGCGRQATYVQLCDAPVDNPLRACAWVMNGGTPGDIR
jgi:hypothetical protein